MYLLVAPLVSTRAAISCPILMYFVNRVLFIGVLRKKRMLSMDLFGYF